MTEEQEQQEQAPVGGVITKIERQARSKQRYNVFLDGLFAFSVHEDLMVKFRLLKGASIEPGEYEHILIEEERHRGYSSALRLLSSRLRSEYEIRERLKRKEFEAEVIDHVAARLKNEGYLNDEMFAEMLTKQRSESHKKGRHWIKQELQQKGIPKEHITNALEQVDEAVEVEAAYQLASKRYRKDWEEDRLKARRKIAGFLQRRGYSGNVVSKVMAKMPAASGDEDWHEFPEQSDFDE
ncbi:regulatory protein [Paenibacillus sp. UNCCL117]|uniref:RecX family transcriptional regulator n=1 Tax=unclassified Paenibacillus TaxID=185978 RepID=UPI00087FCE34|nr:MULTISPECIES: RecX family transcriptional regulator [unclassified Paenibacillus]SDC88669.1 regulatory protein [Paenibacillus sp. cl123]SFW28363.1 regulatory protein [Paenibacillus sp. UNCCL117]